MKKNKKVLASLDEMDEDFKPLLPEKKTSHKSRTPILDVFSRDLNKEAIDGKLDPVIGRDEETIRMAQILARRKKNNPILIGDPGTGKSAIAQNLAIKIVEGNCPKILSNKRIVELDMTLLVSGTKYRGQFEERMKQVMEELKNSPNVILFIDEIHTIIGAGNASGSLDASNIFKPALSRGELQCIGATTLDEYRNHIEKDGALARRFQKVMVEPTSVDETIKILKNIAGMYEKHHNVKFTDEAIVTCVKLADRFITNRQFPDKAIDVMDELGAKAQIEIKYPENIEKLKMDLLNLRQEKINVVKNQNYEMAANLRDEEKRIITELDAEKGKWESRHEITIIKEDDVYDVISQITKIPVNKITKDEFANLLNLEKNIESKIIGQSEAVAKVCTAIRRSRTGIRVRNKPISSFIFIGPSGQGKSYLAKQLAKEIFGSEDALIRLDMSEYSEKFTITKLIGSPAGYIGYGDGGILTEAVNNKPYSVVLFDEIEKADKDIYNILLQIMDEGHLTDSMGRKINFKNCLIILTSNIGIKTLEDFGTGIGFKSATKVKNQKEESRMVLEKELRKIFNPEFINRLDDIIYFKQLSGDNICKIIELDLNKLKERLIELHYDISFDKSTIKHLSEIGYDEKFGARPIERAIEHVIEDFISDNILKEKIVKDKKYLISIKKDIPVLTAI